MRLRAETLVVEEPLEIRLSSQGVERVVTVTMRTPGADQALAIGFLISERIIESVVQVKAIRVCGTRANVIKVELRAGATAKLDGIERNFASSASCGLCGKASIEAVASGLDLNAIEYCGSPLDTTLLRDIPQRLRAAQEVFAQTGGLHAVAAFDRAGDLLAVQEDIGRHNAVDKVIGTLAGTDWDPGQTLFALSGRAGFELIQKAAAVRIPVVVAIGAPSSLAVELAERAGITLIGFLRSTSFNVYSHPQRLADQSALAVGA